MATYKNKMTVNIDTYKTNTDGVLSAKEGFLKPGEQFNANDSGNVLLIISGEDSGRYVYEKNCSLVSITPPPPPPPPTGIKTIEVTHEYKTDGVITDVYQGTLVRVGP